MLRVFKTFNLNIASSIWLFAPLSTWSGTCYAFNVAAYLPRTSLALCDSCKLLWRAKDVERITWLGQLRTRRAAGAALCVSRKRATKLSPRAVFGCCCCCCCSCFSCGCRGYEISKGNSHKKVKEMAKICAHAHTNWQMAWTARWLRHMAVLEHERGRWPRLAAAAASVAGKGRAVEIKMIFNLTRLRAAICLPLPTQFQWNLRWEDTPISRRTPHLTGVRAMAGQLLCNYNKFLCISLSPAPESMQRKTFATRLKVEIEKRLRK